MPFLDFNAGAFPANPGPYDIVVVGAGAAGILLAVKLSEKGRRVLLVESGHFALDDDRQSLNELEETGKRLGNQVWTRKRAIGGTTVVWGGQSLPFRPLDFAARDWVALSGWPIEFAALSPHYDAANAFMGVDQLNYDTDLFAALRLDPVWRGSPELYQHLSKWSNQPNFYKRNKRWLKDRVDVLYNAQLTRIDLGEPGANAVQITNFHGQSRLVTAPVIVLATGAIEANRTLLLNSHQAPDGLGAQAGWLGKAYMDHPTAVMGRVETDEPRRLQAQLATHVRGLRRYSIRLSATEAWQRSRRLLNVSAGFSWSYPAEADDPLHNLRRLARQRDLAALPGAARDLPRLWPTLTALARSRYVYRPGAAADVFIMTEQEPSRDSFIGLSDRLDRFGLRQAQLHWRLTEASWRTLVAFTHTLQDALQRAGLGRLVAKPGVRADNPAWDAELADVNHHMGGTRMSARPSEGVVDANLQVWGAPNLYVCSASVFPTGSHSNPTLTLLALASRLAERL